MTFKRCGRCKAWKPSSEFGRDASAQDGMQWACRACHNASIREWYAKNPETARQRVQDYKLRNPEIVARNQFRGCARQWGLDPDELEARFGEHDGRCEICGLTATESCPTRKRLSIDHDHATKLFRGFLCHGCNAGLGGFKDNPALLVAAIRYLADHARKQADAA